MTTPDGGDDAVPVSELSYTEASRELDAIVGFFEQREVDVDELVVRLERASAIVDELDRRVRRTRAQVEELVPRLEAVNRGVPADGAARAVGPNEADGSIEDDDIEGDIVAAGSTIGDLAAPDDGAGDDPALF